MAQACCAGVLLAFPRSPRLAAEFEALDLRVVGKRLNCGWDIDLVAFPEPLQLPNVSFPSNDAATSCLLQFRL